MEGTFKNRVLLLLDEKGPASISEISKGLDGSKEFVSGYLHGLADCGVLKAKQVGRAKVFLKKKQNMGTGRHSKNSVKRTQMNTKMSVNC